MSDREDTREDNRILRSARRPIAHLALGPEDDTYLFRQRRARLQQQRRARAAEASKALASEAAASEAMATSAQQTTQAGSSGSVGSIVAQTQSQSVGVMASQPPVMTPEEVAIQRAAAREAQLQQALGERKAEKERMIRRRARMQWRQEDVSELGEMDPIEMDDDVRVIRSVLLSVMEMQDHQTEILQDIQQSLAVLVGRMQASPSPFGPGAWPVAHPPPFVPPVTSPYVAPSSVAIVSLGMPLSGGLSAGPSLQVLVQPVYSQPPLQIAVTTQPAVSQPVQPQGAQPLQPVQPHVSQGPQPNGMQGPGQTHVVPQTRPDPSSLCSMNVFEFVEELEEWSRSDPLASWTALVKTSKGEMFVSDVVIGGRKAGAYYDTCSTRNFISRACVERLRLQGQVQRLSRPVESTCANKQRMVVNDYLQDVECCFPYARGELRHRVLFLVSDELPMHMLLGMYYLSVAQPQFDWDRKVVKHTLPGGGTARLRKFKASSLIESHGCMCAAAFYNYYKQNQEEGMYLVHVSAAGKPVKMPPEIEGVVAKYPDLFEEPTGVVEREVVHAIEIIAGSSIPKGRIYRMSPGELDELRRQLKELVEKGWIRPSVSPYGSPVLFVPKKKEGTLRMCIDYRGLNAITVKNREPLPRINGLLDRVQGCRYFSKIDLKSGYHQIAIRPEDQHKTAFRTRYSLYEFVVMPFGLCNAPGTFQHAMNRIFHDYLDKFVILYLDDILTFSKTVEEHVAHLDKVLSLLRQHKFKINGEKCEFGCTCVLYLGHEISTQGLKPDDAMVASIRDWPRPQSVTEMRSFLGMTDYYRNFVKNYSIPQYIKGEYNKVADALSRRPDFSCALITEFGLEDNVTQSMVEAYREDPFMSEIIRRLEAKEKVTSAEFELVNNLLFLDNARNKRLRVPNRESLRSLFLGECHDATGHFGFKKTAANLLQRFWWLTMIRDAKLYVETCHVCQRDKPHTQAPLGLLKPLPIPERPGESLSMDFMDTLVTSKSGMRHIFVIVVRFSKYGRLVAMPETAKTEYVIRMFKENWVRDFGLPKSIISDKDVRFTTELWKAAAAEQGTPLQMTSGNHPEANGQAEQLNRAVQHLMRHYIKPNQVDWDEKLALIASLYNNAVHSATGVSPNRLLLTFKPRLPVDFLFPKNQSNCCSGYLRICLPV
ncbi:hypothetical protein CBR_g63097 [Chara braunii]|uniref:Integrase catalytic domain-containing protein n=1 Tax=Chara braunii TaxID=69332 RepID=A0A388K8Y9_CHABU|nr:hypothetical protein CBR_g63097 [Chara braunii]|eukprot:GBG66515.1 hypothetical protein CBR_g63097 [Chara braunii]